MRISDWSSDVCSSDLFPGPKPKKPLSTMAMPMLLRRMKANVTVHGFRSTFRDWASETTGFSHEVCEMALAHTIGNKAEAARSEEHTSELQSLMRISSAVFCLKKQKSQHKRCVRYIPHLE